VWFWPSNYFPNYWFSNFWFLNIIGSETAASQISFLKYLVPEKDLFSNYWFRNYWFSNYWFLSYLVPQTFVDESMDWEPIVWQLTRHLFEADTWVKSLLFACRKFCSNLGYETRSDLPAVGPEGQRLDVSKLNHVCHFVGKYYQYTVAKKTSGFSEMQPTKCCP
jgi:hypothetical protein